MTMQRIRMPRGHVELSLGGVNYQIDEAGAFEIPVEHVADLQRVHGAVLEQSLQQMEQSIEFAESEVQEAKKVLQAKGANLQAAKLAFSKAKEKLETDAAARGRADAEAAAAAAKKADGK